MVGDATALVKVTACIKVWLLASVRAASAQTISLHPSAALELVVPATEVRSSSGRGAEALEFYPERVLEVVVTGGINFTLSRKIKLGFLQLEKSTRMSVKMRAKRQVWWHQ